jgi:hypothetical protein
MSRYVRNVSDTDPYASIRALFATLFEVTSFDMSNLLAGRRAELMLLATTTR